MTKPNSVRHTPIEDLDVFMLFEQVADWAWETVKRWPTFDRDVLGRQLLTAIDSVGANLVEGDGRYGDADGIRFFVIARASAREARLWVRRGIKRSLVAPAEGEVQLEKMTRATVLLNKLINYRRTRGRTIAEELASYRAADLAEQTIE